MEDQSIQYPEKPLTQEMLASWYKALFQDRDKSVDSIPHYSVYIDEYASRKVKQYLKRDRKLSMSNRARRLLRNRRKMK